MGSLSVSKAGIQAIVLDAFSSAAASAEAVAFRAGWVIGPGIEAEGLQLRRKGMAEVAGRLLSRSPTSDGLHPKQV